MKIESIITRTTYRVSLDKKCYLCCVIECVGRVRFSISREWGFPIRPHTKLWEEIYEGVRSRYESLCEKG